MVNSVLNNKTRISSDRLIRVQTKAAQRENIDETIDDVLKLTYKIVTVAANKKIKELGFVFVIIDKIYRKSCFECNFPLDKLNECKVYGNVILLMSLSTVNLNGIEDHGSTVVCDGRLSIVVSLEIRPSDNGFNFFISESNLLKRIFGFGC